MCSSQVKESFLFPLMSNCSLGLIFSSFKYKMNFILKLWDVQMFNSFLCGKIDEIFITE